MRIENRDEFFINLVVMIAIMVLFQILPPVSTITRTGMNLLGIFIAVIYGWCAIGIGYPSILGFLAVPFLTDIVSPAEMIAAGCGTPTFYLCVVAFFLSAFIIEQNLLPIISSFFLNLSFAKGKPYLTMYIFLIACFVVAVMSAAAPCTMVIVIPLYTQFAKSAGIKPYDKLNAIFLIGILTVICMGDIAFPFKTCAIVLLGAFQGATNIAINFGVYTIIIVPICFLILAAYVLFAKLILRVDASCLKECAAFTPKVSPTKKQKISFALVAIYMAIYLLPSVFPKSWGITQWFNEIGLAGTSIIIFTLMATLRAEGEALFAPTKLARNFSWDALFMIMYFIPVSGYITSDMTGIKECLSIVIGSTLGNLSPIIFVIIAGALGAVLTNFLNNMVIGAIMVSVLGTIGYAIPGLNVEAAFIAIVYCTFLGIAMPSANPVAAYVFGMKDTVRFGELAKVGWLAVVLYLIIGAPILYVLGCMIF